MLLEDACALHFAPALAEAPAPLLGQVLFNLSHDLVAVRRGRLVFPASEVRLLPVAQSSLPLADRTRDLVVLVT